MSTPPDDSAAAPSRSRPSRRRRLLLGLGLGVAALVALRVALPWAAARGGERLAADALGTPVAIGGVDFGLLRGVVTVSGVVAGPRSRPGGPVPRQTAYLAARRLEARIDWGVLLRERRVHLHRVAIEGPLLRLERRSDGSVALARTSGDGKSPGEEASRPQPETQPETQPESQSEPRPEAAVEPRAGSGSAAGPEAARSEAEAERNEGGIPARIDRVRIADAAVALVEAAGGAPLLKLSLEALELRDLVLGAEPLRLGSVALEEPSLRIERALLAPPPEAPPASPESAAEEGGPGAAYQVDRLVIERGRFALGGGNGAEPLELGLAFEATNLTAAPGERFALSLRLDAGEGFFRAEGDGALAPPAFDGRLEWRELPLGSLLAAGAPEPAAWLRTGRSNGELRVDGRLGAGSGAGTGTASGASPEGAGAPGLDVAGKVSLAELDLQDPSGSGVGLGVRELSLGIGRGRLRFAAGEGAAGGAPEVGAASLDLEAADFRFADLRVAPAYRLKLSSLRAGARDLVWPEAGAGTLELEARSESGPHLQARGELPGGEGWIEASLEDLRLPPLTPYAEPAIGLGFAAGSLAGEGRAEIAAGRTAVESVWRIEDLVLRGGDPGIFERTVGISRGLALALLRGPGGGIRLPLSFTVAEGQLVTHFGDVVRGALRQTLIGILSTPLKALGAVLPTGDAPPAQTVAAPIPAEPGAVEPTGRGRERIRTLAELLGEHPDLAAVLRGRTAAGGEIEAAAEPAAPGPPPRTPLHLAQRRALRVRDVLVSEHGLDPARVAVASPAPAGEPGVVVELIPLAPAAPTE